MHRPLFGPEILEGMRDALQLLLESDERAEHPRRTQTVTEPHLREAAEAMWAALEDPPKSLPDRVDRLQELEVHAETLLDIARTRPCWTSPARSRTTSRRSPDPKSWPGRGA
jgi:hypothetical protein